MIENEMYFKRILFPVFVLVSAAATHGADAISSADREFFEKKIRPVLVDKCYKCHATTSKKIKAGLVLDGRAGMIKGGETGPAIVPGKPEKSLMIEAISYTNVDIEMPSKGKLPDDVIADFTKWVKMGAPWPGGGGAKITNVRSGIDLEKRKRDHWAWQPVKKYPLPQVKNGSWPRQSLDHFVLAKLEEKGYKPAPQADRRTLIRRAYFDLIGLPPTPEEVDAFVNDRSRGAYEKVVDRLLASSHFGERWARYWMDLTRYAESRGHEFDYTTPNAHQYRDYLIRAFNVDVPYNQFVTEHVAGDLLANPRLHPTDGFNESVLATGFWFMGEWVHSPVDIRKDEADRFDNMVDVMTKSFLSVTIACGRCHDHKFDPIRQLDYYAMHGFLQSSSYRLVRFESIEHNKKIAVDLAALRNRARPRIQSALARSSQPVLARLDDYLLAAREATRGGATSKTTAGPSNGDVVFEDFESGTYDGWTITGAAFGRKPQTWDTIPDYQGKINRNGTWFVNSHNIRAPAPGSAPGSKDVRKGDPLTGTMTSKPFRITHRHITMLVGGGSHKGKTCVNLLIKNRTVMSATGRSNNQMFPVAWDVKKYIGKSARIQVVDNHEGGWGNIGLDHIVFTNKASSTSGAGAGAGAGGSKGPADVLTVDRQRIAAIARKHRLDEKVLAKWIEHLLNHGKDSGDPMHAWSRAMGNGSNAVTHASQVATQLDQQQKKAAAALAKAEVVVDFRKDSEPLLQDGVSFGVAPVRPGDVEFGSDPAQPITRVFGYAAAQHDPTWNVLRVVNSGNNAGRVSKISSSGRMYRTPTFTLTHGVVHYLAKGNADVYAVVDSHRMNNGPLHGSLISNIKNTGEFKWYSQDLRRYKDHGVHIEFTPKGNDGFALAMVVQGEVRQNPLDRGNAVLSKMLQSVTSDAALAEGYQNLFKNVTAKLASDGIRGSSAAADYAKLADWVVHHPTLFGLSAGDDSRSFFDQRAKLVGRIKRDSRTAMAIMDGSSVDEHVMIRGSHKSLGAVAPRRFLEVIDGPNPMAIARGSGRLDLAKRFTDPSNPLISRSIVNRIWHHLFARGIVASVDDLGKLGSKPTHPKMLDHLADQFVSNGWSIKKMLKTIMMSSTYQMSSKPHDTRAEELDPDDLYLHRMRIRRLQGEAIRDAIISVSGRLDRKMYGPSVNVYLTRFMEGRGRPKGGPMDGAGRRSIYTAIRRNFLPPMMLVFDMPIPFNTIGRRSVSNVPAQALILMNDPFVVQQAELWAKRVMSDSRYTTQQRIDQLCQMAFARHATQLQVVQFTKFLEQQAAAHGATVNDQRPWADLCHVIINTKEFIFIN